MAVAISDLSPRAQKQALKKIQAQEALKPKNRPKYNNVKTEVVVENVKLKFDSKKEARRFEELRIMQAAGMIRNLKLQHEFTLLSAFTTPEGERTRAIRYMADFTYDTFKLTPQGNRWVFIVEDVKSKATKTPSYIMKKKMTLEKHGIEIQEV